MKNLFIENLNHLIVMDFWIVVDGPYVHKSIWLEVGELCMGLCSCGLLGLVNYEMASTSSNIKFDLGFVGFVGG
jgi:hypothetical protein